MSNEMFGAYSKAVAEINEKIAEIEKRILAGEEVIRQCKKQMTVLKRKIREYRRLKTETTVKYVGSAADGDL